MGYLCYFLYNFVTDKVTRALSTAAPSVQERKPTMTPSSGISSSPPASITSEPPVAQLSTVAHGKLALSHSPVSL